MVVFAGGGGARHLVKYEIAAEAEPREEHDEAEHQPARATAVGPLLLEQIAAVAQ